MGTHYDTLGVASSASSEEIRKAYLRRARALHPDRQHDRAPAEARRAELAMQQVNAAWTVLSDPDKRSAYDRKLRPATTTTPRAASVPSAARPAPRSHATVPPRVEETPGRAFDEQPGDGTVSIWASIPVLIIVGVLLGILIITAFAGGEPTNTRTPAPTARTAFEIGDCFALIGDSPALRTCGTGSAEFVVVDLLPNVGNCPSDTQGVVDPANGRALCFKQLIPGSAVTAG